jgi:hypothetical protein
MLIQNASNQRKMFLNRLDRLILSSQIIKKSARNLDILQRAILITRLTLTKIYAGTK